MAKGSQQTHMGGSILWLKKAADRLQQTQTTTDADRHRQIYLQTPTTCPPSPATHRARWAGTACWRCQRRCSRRTCSRRCPSAASWRPGGGPRRAARAGWGWCWRRATRPRAPTTSGVWGCRSRRSPSWSTGRSSPTAGRCCATHWWSAAL